MKYFITYHAIERLKERFPNFYSKHTELKNWNKQKGTACVKSLFDKWIDNSEENRSYVNNSTYMVMLYEKYGYDSEYCFLEYKEENILFILTKNRSESNYKLVTLMPTEFRPSVKNVKFNGKKTKEDKYNKFVMDWYEQIKKTKTTTLLISENNYNEINEVKSLECSSELKDKLKNLVATQETVVISRISNSKTLHTAVIGEEKYNFIYSKTNNGTKEVFLQSIAELSQEERKKKELQNWITAELKQELLTLVFDNMTESQKISNSKSAHKVIWNGNQYHFICQKTSPGDRNIILQEEPKAIKDCKLKF